MSIPEWARLLLPLLVSQAKACETITYGDLADKVGRHHRPIPRALGYIRDNWCRPYGIPEINVLVVNQDTREPGESFLAGGTAHLTLAQRRMAYENEKQRVCQYTGWGDLLIRLGLK